MSGPYGSDPTQRIPRRQVPPRQSYPPRLPRRPYPPPAPPRPARLPPPPPARRVAPPPAPLPKRSNRRLWIVGGIVAIAVEVVLLVVGVSMLEFGDTKELDVNKAQAGVQQVLTDPAEGYGVENLTAVRCNNGRNPTVEKGAGFTCEVIVNGLKRKVAAVFVDDDGTYEVDRPR